MPNELDLNIILRFTDKLTGEIAKAQNAVVKFAGDVEKAGRIFQRVGFNMTFLAAAITGPMVLAFKAAAQGSLEVSEEVRHLNTIMQDMRDTIAIAMIPVIHELGNRLGALLERWKALRPEVQNAIIQGIFITGIVLALGGVILLLGGRILRLAGWIIGLITIMSPWQIALLAVGAIAITLITIFDKWKVALNGIEILFNMVAIGFLKMVRFIETGLENAAIVFARFMNLLVQSGALTEEQAAHFANAGRAAIGFAKDIRESQATIDEWIIELEANITQIIETGEGDLIPALEKMREKFLSIFAPAPEIETGINEFIQNFKKIITEYTTAIENVGKTTATILVTSFQQMTQGFGNAVGRMIVYGQDFGKSMRELFKQVLSDFIAKIVAMTTEWIAITIIGKGVLAAAVAASVAAATTVAAAWATAAAMVNAATFGAGAAAGAAGIVSITTLANTLAMIPKPMALGGEGVVTRPTLFLAGEAGPERYAFKPMAGREGTTFGNININIGEASFREDEDLENFARALSQKLEEARRARI